MVHLNLHTRIIKEPLAKHSSALKSEMFCFFIFQVLVQENRVPLFFLMVKCNDSQVSDLKVAT